MSRTRPERHRRGDRIAAAALALAVLAAVVVLWRTSPATGTTASPAAVPIVAPPEPAGVPAAVVEAWRAPSPGTPRPVTAGPAVVTAEGSAVVGRDAVTGAERWRYARDLPLCAVGAGFPAVAERVLALYSTGAYCSELTALEPATGVRAKQRNTDARPGVRLLAGRRSVALVNVAHVEVLRSDLVRSLEVGAVPAPEQPGRQPRIGCRYSSSALASGRIGLVERCPGEPSDRLTVLSTEGPGGAESPHEQFSVPLPAEGGIMIALSADRAAVALPGPPRLLIVDHAGMPVAQPALDVPEADLAADPAVLRMPDVSTDGGRVSWWTGSRTVALGVDLTPLWTLPGTRGAALAFGGSLLVPVPSGLAETDAGTGAVRRILPVARADPAAPVRLARQGEVLLEQRGVELVALRPAR